MPFGDSYSQEYQQGGFLTTGSQMVHTSLGMGSVFASYPKDDLQYEGQKVWLKGGDLGGIWGESRYVCRLSSSLDAQLGKA